MTERQLAEQIAMFRHRATATVDPDLRARHERMVAWAEARLADAKAERDSAARG